MPRSFVEFYIKNEDIENLLDDICYKEEYIDVIETLFDIILELKEENKWLKTNEKTN